MLHFYCGSAFFHIAIESMILENTFPIFNPEPSSRLGKEAEPSRFQQNNSNGLQAECGCPYDFDKLIKAPRSNYEIL